MQEVNIKEVYPDKDQPRKTFTSEKMGQIKKSIKSHGILNPIVVEKTKDGYKIIDGERRYRAAQKLGLKKVPVEEIRSSGDLDTLIKRFHIQEQREGWTPIEKAIAMEDLRGKLKVSLNEMVDILNLPRQTVTIYASFSKIRNRDNYIKSEISMDWVTYINSVLTSAKQSYLANAKEMSDEELGNLEKALIDKIENGIISEKRDMRKLKSAFLAEYKMVNKFANDKKMTIVRAFLDSNAQAVEDYRNLKGGLAWALTHMKQGHEHKFEDLFKPEDVTKVKRVIKEYGELLKRIS